MTRLQRNLRVDIERRRQGLSQAELARRSRINESNLSMILSGKRVPYDPELARLAKALGIPKAELLQGADGNEE